LDLLNNKILGNAESTRILGEAFKSMGTAGVASFLGIADVIGKYAVINTMLSVALEQLAQNNWKGAQYAFDQVMKAVQMVKSISTDTPLGDKKTKGSKTSSEKPEDEFAKALNLIEQQVKLFELTRGLKGISLQQAKKELELLESQADTIDRQVQYYSLLNELIEKIYSKNSYIKSEKILTMRSPDREPVSLIPEREGYKMSFVDEAGLRLQQAFNDTLEDSVSLIGEFFQGLSSGNPDAFKEFMKRIVVTFLTSVQAMLVGAKGASAAKGITTFGLSLITDMPMLAAGYLALEAAKGIIMGLNKGGVVPGSGDTDSVPAMLTPGEVVISKPRVKQLTSWFGSGFKEWLVGDGLAVSMAKKYNPSMLIPGAVGG
ncbi:MAG TPA: hypothetical protein PK559_15475, partial [Ignavibacteriaceae bacterium]|nr:hypothetical protein [Ignavibacteriaceae bacterium]